MVISSAREGVAPSVLSTTRSGSWYESGLSRTARITENSAVFAPIPRAIMSTTDPEKPGFLRMVLRPNFRPAQSLLRSRWNLLWPYSAASRVFRISQLYDWPRLDSRKFPAAGNDLCIISILYRKKTGHLPEISCITIERRSETPLAKFEECLQRLEKIVQELEKGEVPLEKSLTLFEEGMQLSSSCRKELEQAEGKVEILLKKNGKLQAEPFEPLTEKAPARR